MTGDLLVTVGNELQILKNNSIPVSIRIVHFSCTKSSINITVFVNKLSKFLQYINYPLLYLFMEQQT